MDYYPQKSLTLLAGMIILIVLLVLSGFFIRKLTPLLEDAYYIEPQIQLNKIYRNQNL